MCPEGRGLTVYWNAVSLGMFSTFNHFFFLPVLLTRRSLSSAVATQSSHSSALQSATHTTTGHLNCCYF
ncbi:hypothetical protein AMECASPLE_010748 [Ameca splendens]|uniref:Uncharacterized protein n=1 Tax=Ameca splendens TaxID=208324 RepID=A0ABV0Z9F2_9TELE